MSLPRSYEYPEMQYYEIDRIETHEDSKLF